MHTIMLPRLFECYSNRIIVAHVLFHVRLEMAARGKVAFKDKEKPTEVRYSNITAAKGALINDKHGIQPNIQLRFHCVQPLPTP